MGSHGDIWGAKMQLVTEKQLVLEVVKAWERQYPGHGSGQWSQEVSAALKQLDLTTATAEDIEAIIGNSSWTAIRCNECNCRVKAAVQLGEDPDYDSATAVVCFDCLRKALALEPENWLCG